MKYILKIDTLGTQPEIKITEKEYKNLEKAKKILSNALEIEEKHEIVISNYLEFEKRMVNLAIDAMIKTGKGLFKFL